jgi:hypothetical protein
VPINSSAETQPPEKSEQSGGPGGALLSFQTRPNQNKALILGEELRRILEAYEFVLESNLILFGLTLLKAITKSHRQNADCSALGQVRQTSPNWI